MKLAQLRATILATDQEDWERIDHYIPDGWDSDEGEPSGHHTYAVLKDDIDISMAMGLQHLAKYAAPWMPEGRPFPDSDLSSCWVTVRYRGQVVIKSIIIFLDGARYAIPTPDFDPASDTWYMSKSKLTMGKLFAPFLVPGETEDYMERVLTKLGLRVV